MKFNTNKIKDFKINIYKLILISTPLLICLIVLLIFLIPFALIGYVFYEFFGLVDSLHRRTKLHSLNKLKLKENVY